MAAYGETRIPASARVMAAVTPTPTQLATAPNAANYCHPADRPPPPLIPITAHCRSRLLFPAPIRKDRPPTTRYMMWRSEPMSDAAKTDTKTSQTLLWAHVSCLTFGAAMILWGLAPPIIQRITSGSAPTLDMLAQAAVPLLLGLLLATLAVLIKRGVSWALWTSLGLSVSLLIAMLSISLCNGTGLQSIFSLLLASCTAGMSGLALTMRRPHNQDATEAPQA